MHDDLRAAVAADMPRLKGLLETLVRMESVSADGFDPTAVCSAAGAIVVMLDEAGFENAQLLESSTGHPAVFAEIPAPEGAPTVLLYAHYDVQPTGPIDEWETGPFDPFEKDGRLYGRGSADDKAGIVMHLGAIAAHSGDGLPVGVQLFFEGEEEAGSIGLPEILDKYSDLISPDVIVIGDGGLWQPDTPAIISSLRGIVAVKLELRTLHSAVHSGQAGGVVPDALMALSRLLASLHDDEGNVAVAGLVSDEITESIDVPEEMARRETGAIDGLSLIGEGSIPSRLWTRPAISVLAIDAPPVAEAINQLVPVARAKVSMRIPPGQDTDTALRALKDHLVANVPWGAELTFVYEEKGDATVLETDNFAVDAWRESFAEAFENEMVAMGAGGSIPFIATFNELFPDAPILVTGVSDPTSAYHAPNENVGIDQLERATLAEAIALRLVAERS
jgi:acetylornithine deacetylase/succinyl-diaminopimelate desuccinylase-like protein